MYGTGKASIDIYEMIAGSIGTWTIVYETGRYGVDDGGEIIIARRVVCDSDIPQFDNPHSPGYVSVYGNTEATLNVSYNPHKYIRPWRGCICIKVTDGSLKKGDKIFIQYGASEGKGMGYRIQTFAEEEHIFNVLVDCAGSGNFYPVESSPVIRIRGGYIDKLEAVAPSLVTKNHQFDLLVRALDSWGNIAEKYDSTVTVRIDGEKNEAIVSRGIGHAKGCRLTEEGKNVLDVMDDNMEIQGKSNPVICTSQDVKEKLFWGDLHGQTRETVGTGSLDEYFSFARDKAGMSFSAWQGNDFQVTDELWANVNSAVKKYHNPGSFITFLGYEWSGTTPAGGDYNIYYLLDDQSIHRSYKWQIGMENSDETDKSPISQLWEHFKGRNDVMAIPHVGGRYANLDYYDENFVHLVEIHSHHGTFEWLFEEALQRGYQVGVVAGSDDHTCRPGLSYPSRRSYKGFASFDVRGGYVGVWVQNLTRKDLWDAMKMRHCYGTTGERIIVEVTCGHHSMGDAFSVDKPPRFHVDVTGTNLIHDIEIKRGLETIYSHANSRPLDKNIIKVQWSGVRVRSRSKKTNWDGSISIENGRIKGFKQYAFDQPDEGVTQISNQLLVWTSKTSGDIDGIELELEYDKKTKLLFDTAPVNFSVTVDDLKNGPIIKDAGGVNQRVKVSFGNKSYHPEASFVFEDKGIKAGINPYWIKVVQSDGHMAWTSPMYITYT